MSDNERMKAAADRAGVLYAGCDMPEHLADAVVALRDDVRRLRAALLSEFKHAGRAHARIARVLEHGDSA